MLSGNFTLIGLLVGSLLLSGCDKDPLSQKGKIFLPDSQTDSETPQDNGNIFQYSPLQPEVNPMQTSDEIKRAKETAATSADVMEIDWDVLIPDSHRPDTELIDKYNNGEIDAKDPLIIALKALMRELLELGPVNHELAGKMIKMPGFVIPLEHDGDKITEFLLVPYHGACIHVPAPPSNQIIYVRVPGGTTAASRPYDTVWVTGRLTIEQIDNDVAESGYVMDAIEVEPFE